MRNKFNLWTVISLLVIFAMVLAACAQTTPTEEAMTEPETAATEAPVEEAPSGETTEAPFPVIPGGYLEKAMAGEYEGTTVTVDGPFTDADKVKFEQS